MLKNLAKNLALVGLSIGLCLLLFDAGLRIVYGNPAPWLYPQVRHRPAPYGYKLVPNQSGTFTVDKPVRSNSAGFRGDEWSAPEDSSTIRIMVLGDSFTFGNNSREEDAFPSALESRLRAEFGRIEVLNAGVGGWDVDNQAEFFVTEGTHYAPHVVVIAFFSNDYEGPQTRVSVPPLSEDERLESRPGWLRWVPYRVLFLLKRSAVVIYLRQRVTLLAQGSDAWNARLFRNEVDLDSDPRVQFTYQQLLRIRDAAQVRNIPVLIAVLPSVNTFWRPRDSLDWVSHLGAFAQANGIEFIDLAEGFWAFENTDQFFGYPWDNHFLPSGHRLVAEQLAPLVAELVRRVRPAGDVMVPIGTEFSRP